MDAVARRILHVVDSTRGGLGRFVSMHLPLQLRAGDEVIIAAPPGDVPRALSALGVDHREWHAARRPGPRMRQALTRLARIVALAQPNVVHLHSDMPGLVGRLLLRGRLPTVFQPHAWSFIAVPRSMRRGALAWERAGARWADVVLCVSHEEADIAGAAGVRGRLVVAPNGVDLQRFAARDAGDRIAARARLGIDRDVALAICVGRLHRQKGQETLVRAWPSVRARVPGAVLALIGDGPDRDALAAAASAGVRLMGITDDVQSWLASADVVVAPSRWEGMSLSILEALASARSVIATDVPGMRDLRAGVGALVRPDSPDALADAIACRLANPSIAAADGLRGRALAEQGHNVHDQHSIIASIYSDLTRVSTNPLV